MMYPQRVKNKSIQTAVSMTASVFRQMPTTSSYPSLAVTTTMLTAMAAFKHPYFAIAFAGTAGLQSCLFRTARRKVVNGFKHDEFPKKGYIMPARGDVSLGVEKEAVAAQVR